MKPTELNNEEMKETSGGMEKMTFDGPDYMPLTGADTGDPAAPSQDTPHPISDGVGETNQSTYGTPYGPIQ